DRGRPPSDIRQVEESLIKFSQLIIDYPQIKEVDVNPFLANEEGVIALDARIVLDHSENNQ
ncbi:MAG: hypothetical protein GWN01_14465, partial [Nitrosopumilaceae archaeon]|nr:hypothetical protein [Nitrosopumilaceae archaeon]NIU82755.1 hypothetical protein [Candidatus Thorarchaeota archaeon]NIV66709.1 hypothetical protein [Nitrosopumilaceae archaeon]NIX62662.1 hypothetical protein [Nitrosopumilaceae archaeon]